MTDSKIVGFFDSVIHIIQTITFVDVIDILLISVILYFAYKFVRDRRAGRLAIGVVMLVIVLLLCSVSGMHAMQYIFKNIFQVGIVAIIILFQPECRSALEKMGAGSIKGIKNMTDRNEESILLAVRETVVAANEMSLSKTGALIVFERTTKLGEIQATGTVIDAQVSSFLLRNIFFNKAPLHDGAVIISGGRISTAGCLLPLSAQKDINRNLGTRHRAAIGISESCDAVAVVVSEETGAVSVAVDGKIIRDLSDEELRKTLTDLLIRTPDAQKNKRRRKTVTVEDAKEDDNGENG